MQNRFDKAAGGEAQQQASTLTRKFIIFDFDGVLQSYGELSEKEILALYARNKIRAVRVIYPNWEISDDNIVELGRASYQKTGDGKLLYADIAIERGIIRPDQKDEYREKMLRTFHRHMLADVRKTRPQIFERNEELISHFRQLSEHFTFGILTQSCKENWVKPILEEMGLLEFFDEKNILDFHDAGYELKGQSPKPLNRAIEVSGFSPAEMIFVEDSEKNLETARKFIPDILNGYIYHDEEPQARPDYIDIASKGIMSFLQKLWSDFRTQQPKPKTGFIHG